MTQQLRRKRTNGAFIAETPAVLWMLFILVAFPLLDLATIGLRYTFVLTSSREAVMAASRAKTFATNPGGSELSATNAANTAARNVDSKFNGFTVTNVNTRIVITNLITQAVTRQDTPLTTPADTDDFLYAYETTVNADIQPLVMLGTNIFGRVPGLTAPVTVAVTSTKICENTQGLNQ